MSGLVRTIRTAAMAAAAMGIVFIMSPTPANAGIITYSLETVDLGAMGFGHVPPILSLQAGGHDSTEWGSVGWNGRRDVYSGDARRHGSGTQTVGDLLARGVSRDLFGIVLNINESCDRDIVLENFSLDVYGARGGAPVFSVSLVGGPLTLAEAGAGQGNAGHLFLVQLDEDEWNTYFAASPTNRIGMSVARSQQIGRVSAGAESFTVAPIPEPATFSIVAGGLMVLLSRRRPQAR